MKNTVLTFQQAKENGEKLTMLTAYDYSTAKLIDEAGVNLLRIQSTMWIKMAISLQKAVPIMVMWAMSRL